MATAWLERLDFPIFRAPFIAIEGVCNYMDGFKFVALRTATEICSDARALDNCLRGYAQVTAEGSDQLWSIRRNGRSVAALHITFSCEGEGLPEIDQIRGYKNSRVTSATLHAEYRWLLTWPGQCRTINADWRRCNVHPATYRKLMKPFWWEKGLVTWLPLAPNDTCFEEVRQGLWNVCDPRRRRRMRLRRARR